MRVVVKVRQVQELESRLTVTTVQIGRNVVAGLVGELTGAQIDRLIERIRERQSRDRR